VSGGGGNRREGAAALGTRAIPDFEIRSLAVVEAKRLGIDFSVLGGSPELFVVNLPIVKLLLAQATESTDPQRRQDRLDRLRELVSGRREAMLDEDGRLFWSILRSGPDSKPVDPERVWTDTCVFDAFIVLNEESDSVSVSAALDRIARRVPYPKANPGVVASLRRLAKGSREQPLLLWRAHVKIVLGEVLADAHKERFVRPGKRWLKDANGLRVEIAPLDDLRVGDFERWLRREAGQRTAALLKDSDTLPRRSARPIEGLSDLTYTHAVRSDRDDRLAVLGRALCDDPGLLPKVEACLPRADRALHELLALVRKGNTRHEIARHLGLSPNALKQRISRLFKRLRQLKNSL
jgi:hypothetical protein